MRRVAEHLGREGKVAWVHVAPALGLLRKQAPNRSGENARKRPPIMSAESSVKGRLNLLGIADGTKVNSAVRNKSFQTRK